MILRDKREVFRVNEDVKDESMEFGVVFLV